MINMGRVKLRGGKIMGSIITAIPRNLREKTGFNRWAKNRPGERGKKAVQDKWDAVVHGKKPRKRRRKRK